MEQENNRKPIVLVYRAELLPFSETFIKEQVKSYRNWTPVLVGQRRLRQGLNLDKMDVRTLLSDNGTLKKILFRILGFFGLALPFQARQLQNLDADLIHVHFGIDAVDIWPAIRKLSLPMIVTLHGYDINISRAWWESGRGGWFRRRYPGQLLAIARDPRVYFVAVSEAIRKRAIEFGIPEEKIAVNYIGVDTGKFVRSGLPVTHRRKRILFVGRLVEKKGCIYLIRAFALVCKSIPDAELMIVGGGPLKGYLEKEAMALNLPVSFLGVLPSEGIKQQLADSRILCLPSVTAENGDAEGFGLVILEAQACGVPVVVSAIGGAKEGILNGQTGFDFAERDIEGLASKIVYMFSHDDVLQGMSDSAVSYVQKAFSIYPCTKALENYYSKVMKACQADGLHGAY